MIRWAEWKILLFSSVSLLTWSSPLFRGIRHCKIKYLKKSVICRKYRFWLCANVILYLFKSCDKVNSLTEVLSVKNAIRREHHLGDSPQVISRKNKNRKIRGFWRRWLEARHSFSYTEKVLRKSERCHKSERWRWSTLIRINTMRFWRNALCLQSTANL